MQRRSCNLHRYRPRQIWNYCTVSLRLLSRANLKNLRTYQYRLLRLSRLHPLTVLASNSNSSKLVKIFIVQIRCEHYGLPNRKWRLGKRISLFNLKL